MRVRTADDRGLRSGSAAAAHDLGARVIPIPPPLLYVAPMLAGLVLRRWTPLSIAGRPASAGAGAVLLLAGLGLAAAGVAAIVRHRTTIVPHHAVSTLVTSGAYRLSRNPMR